MKKILFLLSLAIFLAVFPLRSVLAQNQGMPQAAILSQGEVNQGAYFAAAPSVAVLGTVNGPAYLTGGNVLVGGAINGDLLVAGGVVNITGSVTNDVWILGGEVTIAGPVGGTVTVVGGAVNLTNSARVDGAVSAGGGMVSIFAPIGREVNSVAGQLVVANSVGSGIAAAVGQLTLASGARITGNVEFTSGSDAQVQSGAQVSGQVKRVMPPQAPELPGQLSTVQLFGQVDFGSLLAGLGFLARVIDYIAALIVGYLLLWLLPTFTYQTADLVARQPWRSLWIGVVIFVVTPITILLLMLTIVGIPLALILLALYLIALYLAKIFVFLLIAQLLLHGKGRGWSLLLGLALYEAILLVPFIGWIIALLTFFFGLGALFMKEKEIFTQLKTTEKI